MASPDPLEKTCPLCGGDNHCAMAAGRPAESCWCQNVTLDPQALARIPEASKNKHCVCESCGALVETLAEEAH